MATEPVAARSGGQRGGAWTALPRPVGWVVGSRVVRIIVRRLLLAVPLLLVVTSTTFLLLSVAGNDRADQVHYWRWLAHAVTGDLDRSLSTSEPITTTISQRLPVTLSLILVAIVVIVVVGVGLGIFGAVRDGFAGRFVDAFSMLGFALPTVWLGALLISLFAVQLHWLPAVGYVAITDSPVDWARSLILPVTAIAVHSAAVVAKQTREAMLDALTSEHVQIAWASGIPPRTIYYKLALRLVSVRVVTVAGLQTVVLLGETVFVEMVFALPGLGGLLVDSAIRVDGTLTLGITVVFTLIIVVVNLVVDLAYHVLDPRVRVA